VSLFRNLKRCRFARINWLSLTFAARMVSEFRVPMSKMIVGTTSLYSPNPDLVKAVAMLDE
jgi:hypothetical protein